MSGLREWAVDKVVKLLGPELRSYVVGQGSFDGFEQDFGRDNSQFSPPEYGKYIATSTAVYTCTTLRADLLVEPKLKVYKFKNGADTEVEDGKLVELLQFVNPHWTLSRLLKMTSYALDLWGVNFWFLERGASGKGFPKEIWWARPDRVKVVVSEESYIKGFNYTPPNASKPIFFTPEETIWIPTPNPWDEFNGLAPLASARIDADLALSGKHANKKMFDQGIMLGGMLIPQDGTQLTAEQGKDLEKQIDRRYSGLDKAHRIGVLRFGAKLESTGISPKDAKFLEMLNWTLEDISRVYRIPLDLVGGRRTYENVEAAMKMVWMLAIKPLGRFLGEELTEKLIPMFPGQADEIKQDYSGIEVLQEDRTEIIDQMAKLAEKGTPWNKLLEEFMPNLLPEDGKGYPWGDVWWAPIGMQPITDADKEPIPSQLKPSNTPDEDNPGEDDERMLRQRIAIESDEHERKFLKHMRRINRHEENLRKVVRTLFERQKDSVLDRLKSKKRSAEDIDLEPFDLNKWIKIFREGIRASLAAVTLAVGQEEIDEAAIKMIFSVEAPEVVRAIERQAQSFAVEVNQVTWDAIRESLADGLAEGEGIPALVDRLDGLFSDWMRVDSAVVDKLSRTMTIARTEVVKATSTGSLEAMRQTGKGILKGWLSALQANRTRDSHAEAHMRYQADPIPLEQDFEVGGAVGSGPGLLGVAGEDINCLCSLTYTVVDED